MPGSSPKRKGDGYERELAKYFNEKIFNGEDKVQRMPLSGVVLSSLLEVVI